MCLSVCLLNYTYTLRLFTPVSYSHLAGWFCCCFLLFLFIYFSFYFDFSFVFVSVSLRLFLFGFGVHELVRLEKLSPFDRTLSHIISECVQWTWVCVCDGRNCVVCVFLFLLLKRRYFFQLLVRIEVRYNLAVLLLCRRVRRLLWLLLLLLSVLVVIISAPRTTSSPHTLQRWTVRSFSSSSSFFVRSTLSHCIVEFVCSLCIRNEILKRDNIDHL